MTVCIAAICQIPKEAGGGPAIIACSDRMLTFGDTTEYQPEQQKVYSLAPLAPSSMIFVAGDIEQAVTICNAAVRRLRLVPTTETRLIAEVLSDEMMAYQRRLAQWRVLGPLGLTHEEFLNRQHSLQPDFVRRVGDMMTRVNADVDLLLIGIDREGAHIEQITPGGILHRDPIGFAAIGLGAEHANSQFTLANYHRLWSVQRALMLLYTARRRAEAAPGVGSVADWYVIVPGRPVDTLNEAIVAELEKRYKRFESAQKRVYT